jgi:ABC-2 type transport system permease protein
MFQVFYHYLRHLLYCLKMSFWSAAMYRADFILRLVRSALEITTGIITINIFFLNTPTIAGWTQLQALLVYAIAFFVVSLVMLIGGSGIEGLHREIVNGTLDRFLVQPMDTQWLASTRIIYITNLFRVGFNFTLLLWVISSLEISLTFPQLILFILTLLSACLMYFSILFIAGVISFWALNGELFYLFNSLTSIIRYPADLFPRTIKTLITIIPLIFIATIPAQVLITPYRPLQFFPPLVAIGLFIISRKFWHFGLRTYQSASS